ncbi:hypothetical protein [Bradyrhizobium sp. STM 3562]|uniref:hypothetical protein n=1 Tax=Bradyrhizobium sp. STM 3562 TaxID=578924 RepID=UPI00388D8053
MRAVLALGMLVALGASAASATAHHPRSRHHVFIRPGVASSFAAVPGSVYAPPRPPVYYGDTPSYNDPSKFGGEAAAPTTY